MKNKYYISIIVILFSLLLFSCDKLNELPPNTLIAENAIKDESTAESALNGAYSFFGAYNELNAYSITNQALRIKFLLPSVIRSNYELELTFLAPESSWVHLKNLWVITFKVINAANNVIYQLERFKDEDFSPNRRKEILGEAYFLRGYANLYQMKMFAHFWDINSEYGPLLRLEPANLGNSKLARSTVAEGYESILEDLQFAIDNAPKFKTIYYASKELAKAYKAEALLMRGKDGDYTEVASLANDLIQNGPFTLEGSFGNIYTKMYNCSELMFTRIIKPENIGLQDLIVANVASAYNLLGRKMNAPSDEFFEFFPQSDTRYEHIIGQVLAVNSNNTTYTNTWIKHFEVSGNVPIRFMRISQMYLFLAEALYKTNAPVAQVLAPLNVLRERCGMPIYKESDILVYQDLEDIIFYEIVAEVGVENGSEFFASVRFKNSAGKRKIADFNPAYTSDNLLCLPIPDDEILFNPLMKQNP